MVAIAVGIGAATGAPATRRPAERDPQGHQRPSETGTCPGGQRQARGLPFVGVDGGEGPDRLRTTEDEVVAAINTLVTKENVLIQQASDADTRTCSPPATRFTIPDERGP